MKRVLAWGHSCGPQHLPFAVRDQQRAYPHKRRQVGYCLFKMFGPEMSDLGLFHPLDLGQLHISNELS